MAPTHYLDKVPESHAQCVAKYISDLIAEGGDGTIIALAPQTVWPLQTSIRIRTHQVEICTRGYPKDSNLQAKLCTLGKEESIAIDAHDTRHFKLSHVFVDGKRPELGCLKGGGALVTTGGPTAEHPVIEHCTLTHPRGWSCLHVFDQCQGAVVVNNKVGPAGLQAPDGPWADGLSIACYNGIIANNEIVDATDGAIVLFCAPGTLCVGNTIIARERNLLGGINLVDPFPFETDYTNTRVFNNTIKSEGAYIKLGIGVGPTCWAPVHHAVNHGGSIMDNIIGPGRFGYGIAASGCKDFTMLGNRVALDTEFSGDMSNLPEPLNAPPMPFLRSSEHDWAQGTYQDDFVRGKAVWLIGIEDGPSNKFRFDAGQIKITSDSSTWIRLRDMTLSLTQQGTLLLTRQDGQVLWRSCNVNEGVQDPFLSICTKTGRLQIRNGQTKDDDSSSKVLWDPCEYLNGTGDANIPDRYKNKWGGEAGLTISCREPYLSLWTRDGDLVWATSYVFERGQLQWQPGRYVAVPASQPNWSTSTSTDPTSPSTNGHDVIKGPATFFYFCPHTSHLIVHNGTSPSEFDQVVFETSLFDDVPRQIKSKTDDESLCAYQSGDGNLVVYAHVKQQQQEGGREEGASRRAVWASGTAGKWVELTGSGGGGENKNGAGLTFYGETKEDVVKRIPS